MGFGGGLRLPPVDVRIGVCRADLVIDLTAAPVLCIAAAKALENSKLHLDIVGGLVPGLVG